MNFDILLEEMGNILGFTGLTKSPQGDVTLSFDKIVVTIDSFDDHIFFITKVGELPEKIIDKLALFLLKANSFGILNGYVGIEESQKAITFVTKIPYRQSDANFLVSRLEMHLNGVETLAHGLELMKDGLTEESAPQADELLKNMGLFLRI